VQFSGICEGKRVGLTCRRGRFGIALSEWGWAVLNWWCWEYGGIGGRWWCGACLSGWMVRASVVVHLSSGADLVYLCSRLVSV